MVVQFIYCVIKLDFGSLFFARDAVTKTHSKQT